MKMFLSGVALLAGLALAAPALAAPGQCSVTGYDGFDCEVNVDGGGIAFSLPDGRTFVFAHVADGDGLGYLIAADAQPGSLPEELGAFQPVEGEPGCWFGARDDLKFCVALLE